MCFQSALEDLSHQKATLVAAEESGKWLKESCPSDLKLTSQVTSTLNKVKTLISSTEDELTDTKTSLETSMIRSQDFDRLFMEVIIKYQRNLLEMRTVSLLNTELLNC